MLKKALYAAALATVLGIGALPASAGPRTNFSSGFLGPTEGNRASVAPVFLGPYGRLAGARGILCSPLDERPMDALLCQRSKEEEPGQRFLVAPTFQHDDDADWYGVGLGYANLNNPRHPWNINFGFSHADFDDFEDTEVVDLSGKMVLWMPQDVNLPVVSVVGKYARFFEYGDRFDLLLAADQRITNNMYATVNVGWASANLNSQSADDLIAGFGATYLIRPNFSVSADYLIDNDVDGEDLWTITGVYAFDAVSAVRVGAGDNGTIFANYLRKWDWK